MILNRYDFERFDQLIRVIEGNLVNLNEEEQKSIDARFLRCSLRLVRNAAYLAAHENDAQAAQTTTMSLYDVIADLSKIYLDTCERNDV